jgi:Papain family cysteine protease
MKHGDHRNHGTSRPLLKAAVIAAVVAPLVAIAATANATPVVRPSVVSAASGAQFAALFQSGVAAPTERLAAADVAHPATAVALPASVDLSAYAVSPSNQGRLNACVAFSESVTLAGWENNYQHHSAASFAPMFVYNQINGGRDAGATLFSGLRVMQNRGVLPATSWTYAGSDYRSQPTAAMFAQAASFRFNAPQALFGGANQGTAAQLAIENALAANQPVELAIPVYNAFFSLNSTSNTIMTAAMATGPVAGGHAVVALGYNSTGVQIENSWGAGWGSAGWTTLSWDFINRYAWEADTTSGFAGRSITAPVVTALSRQTENVTGGDKLSITASGLDTVDRTAPAAVQFINQAAVAVNAKITHSTPDAETVTIPALAAGTYRVVVNGAGGASTAGSVGSDTMTVSWPVPVISKVSTRKISTVGAVSTVLTVSGARSVNVVLLQNAATPSVVLAGVITGRTATTVSIATPSATVPGPYHLIAIGTGGTSVSHGAIDEVTYRAPLTPSGFAGSSVPRAGGFVTVSGAGFGTSRDVFKANAITATANGKAVAVTWIDDTHLQVKLPAGRVATRQSLRLFHDSIAGPAVDAPPYA